MFLNGHDEWATELIHRFGLSGLRSMSYQEWERALRRMTNHPLTVALTGVVLKVALLHRPGTLGSFFRAFPCCALEGFRRQQGELLPLPLPEETPADQELREVVEDLFGRMGPMTSSDVENREPGEDDPGAWSSSLDLDGCHDGQLHVLHRSEWKNVD